MKKRVSRKIADGYKLTRLWSGKSYLLESPSGESHSKELKTAFPESLIIISVEEGTVVKRWHEDYFTAHEPIAVVIEKVKTLLAQ